MQMEEVNLPSMHRVDNRIFQCPSTNREDMEMKLSGFSRSIDEVREIQLPCFALSLFAVNYVRALSSLGDVVHVASFAEKGQVPCHEEDTCVNSTHAVRLNGLCPDNTFRH